MRLVEAGTLKLDEDANAKLTSWHVPSNEFDSTHKVTLRGLLSMTGGIGVPGFLGYEVGAPIPTLTEVLNGAPPANSPPVSVIAVPGSAYHYSGGSYEIVEALMQDATEKPFPRLMQDLVLDPIGMTASSFEQPPSAALAASGHFSDGAGLPGRWHIFSEHTAAGLWSTPTDLAKLLVQLADAWEGLTSIFLRRQTLQEMLTPQNGGLTGLAPRSRAMAPLPRAHETGPKRYLILYPGKRSGPSGDEQLRKWLEACQRAD